MCRRKITNPYEVAVHRNTIRIISLILQIALRSLLSFLHWWWVWKDLEALSDFIKVKILMTELEYKSKILDSKTHAHFFGEGLMWRSQILLIRANLHTQLSAHIKMRSFCGNLKWFVFTHLTFVLWTYLQFQLHGSNFIWKFSIVLLPLTGFYQPLLGCGSD